MDLNHPTCNYKDSKGESAQLGPGQDNSSGAFDYCLDNYPLLVDPTHHAPVFLPHSNPIPESDHSPHQQLNIPFPNYPHPQQSAYYRVPEPTFTNEGAVYDASSANQPDAHRVHETEPQMLPPHDSLRPPNSASLMALPHPQNLPGQANGSLHAANGYYSLPELGTHPLTSFDGSGESAPFHPPPHFTTGSTSNLRSDAVYACQCVTNGLTCIDEVAGTIRGVRNHLKQIHHLHASGKKATMCPWTECNKPMQAENVPRHIVSRHFHVKVKCPECGVRLSRRDVQYSHVNACPARRGGGGGGATSSHRFEPFRRRARS